MAYGIRHVLWLCDQSYNKLTQIDYTFLQYSQVISAVPQAYFSVQTQNPKLKTIGFDPLNAAYTIIIEREGTEVFRGEIDLITTPGNNTPIGVNPREAYGSLDRMAFNASSVLQSFNRLIASPDPGSTVYKRSFSGQNLGQIFSTLVGEAASRPYSPVSMMLPGTVEAPVDATGTLITLSEEQALYGSSYLDWFRILSQVSNADWYVRDKVYIDFLKRKGTNRSDDVILKFRKGDPSNNLTGVTLNVDRISMRNKIIVVGALDGLNQVNKEASNEEGRRQFGLREGIVPVRVIDTPQTAQIYAESYVKQVSQAVPIDSIQVYPDQAHEPFKDFSLGDVITVDADFDFVRFRRTVRVMGAVTTAEQDGVERIYYSLQEPLES